MTLFLKQNMIEEAIKRFLSQNISIINTLLAVCLASSILLSSCMKAVENPQVVNENPQIFPDYVGVTIPAGIAPMNFNVIGEDVECVDVVAKGSKGGEMHVQGDYADFDIDEWHALTSQNKGAEIVFTVSVLSKAKWIQYKPFAMSVSNYPLDDYGITYRLLAPGYETAGNIGIYQRDIHSFDEDKIFHETAVPGQCMNCHTANRCNPEQFLIHLRGDKGGTIIQQKDKRVVMNTLTDQTRANCSYSYWHPNGKYIASSTNVIRQLFHVSDERRIEAFDTMSDVLVIDVDNNQLIVDERFQTNDFETYPVFSADGKTIFYCSSRYHQIPQELDSIKYSLCKVSFDVEKGCFGERIDTLLNAETLHKSFTFPRPSYDGKWLLLSVANYGNFPVNHKEADIQIMNLATGEMRSMDEINSDDVDSFHNWSSNSHWIVFSSRRGDGLFTKAYFSSIDEQGRGTKPFLLPQRNPLKYYSEQFQAFNCPDFTAGKVSFDARSAGKDVIDGNRTNVSVR